MDGLCLSEAGVQSGDVIVRVADHWLPIKEDATLDFIKAIEDQIDARKLRIPLGLLRSGEFHVATLETDLQSLDDGLPETSHRLIDMSVSSLKKLASFQVQDGSFVVDTQDQRQTLTTTALAGLALISADKSVVEDFSGNVQRCRDFIASKLDEMAAQTEGDNTLDPLTAACVAIFLAKSDAPLGEAEWLDRFSLVVQAMEQSQHESGGWNVDESMVLAQPAPDTANGKNDREQIERPAPDMRGIFTTNLVLLAIGALERKGLSGDNQLIENGCRWLKQQSRVAVASSLDRRTKASLSAGTVAALLALNCNRNDPDLREYFNIVMERVHDIYFAPQMGEMGLFLAALSARQMGSRDWLPFHLGIKHLEVSLQSPDGSLVRFPGVKREPMEFESRFDNEAVSTALFVMLLTMHAQRTEHWLAVDQPSEIPLRDSSGSEISDEKAWFDSEAQASQLNAANSEELKKLILGKLKERGRAVGSSEIDLQSGKPSSDDD